MADERFDEEFHDAVSYFYFNHKSVLKERGKTGDMTRIQF
jgi:hypothetical protein